MSALDCLWRVFLITRITNFIKIFKWKTINLWWHLLELRARPSKRNFYSSLDTYNQASANWLILFTFFWGHVFRTKISQASFFVPSKYCLGRIYLASGSFVPKLVLINNLDSDQFGLERSERFFRTYLSTKDTDPFFAYGIIIT